MAETIRVNFSRPIPLFPLPDTVLLPHAILPLHIFEPRYRTMIGHCLDRTGQLAVGTFGRGATRSDPDEPAPIRAAVCIGQIIQHDALPDGRYYILLHGVCRAQIQQIIEPDREIPYRQAQLRPLEAVDEAPAPLPGIRDALRRLLNGPRLKRLRGIDTFMEWIDREDVPTHALLELIGFALIRDTEVKYQLLSEADPRARAGIIRTELLFLDRLVQRADEQDYRSWPKGMSWN